MAGVPELLCAQSFPREAKAIRLNYVTRLNNVRGRMHAGEKEITLPDRKIKRCLKLLLRHLFQQQKPKDLIMVEGSTTGLLDQILSVSTSLPKISA
jgi:hypothetical protein